MTEEEAIKIAQKPQDIISPAVCNEVISYITEYINELTQAEWESRLKASQKKVEILSDKTKTNALGKALWEVDATFIDWQDKLRTLRKFKAYRADLRDRFTTLTQIQRRF